MMLIFITYYSFILKLFTAGLLLRQININTNTHHYKIMWKLLYCGRLEGSRGYVLLFLGGVLTCIGELILFFSISISIHPSFIYQPTEQWTTFHVFWLNEITLAPPYRLLYSFLAMCLSVIWDQVPYSGFAMGARFMDTIAWWVIDWLRDWE